MADRLAQGTDYEQDRAQHMPFAPADGMIYHMFSSPGSQQPQQSQQAHYQQHQQHPQPPQHQVMMQPPQHPQPPQHQVMMQQPTHSIHQAIASQNASVGKLMAQAGGGGTNSAGLAAAQQMRRKRQNHGADGHSGGEAMAVEAAGSMTRRNAFLDTIDPAIRRKVEAAQVYFLEYYVDHLTYIANRRRRLGDFKNAIRSVHTTRQHVQDSWSSHCMNESSILRRRRNRTREREFDILAQIGQGGYGQVFLARKRDTGEVCALKKMAKQLLVKLGEVQHILTERDILRTSKSEWLVKLLYSFQDQQSLYLAMEYVPGGDVRTLLNQNGILRHQIARFYIAEMLVAVAALHSFGYFHRDLKPENFLVDANGHIKLTDFGLSHGHLSRPTLEAMKKKLDRVKDQEIIYHSSSEKRSFYKNMRQDDMPRAYSIVGSPDYMAPEILYTSLAMDQQRKKKPAAPQPL
ncbi:serine/threonine-protein kinase dbf2, partial [Coemansia erecta]